MTIAALFDFDGVVMDTETQYSRFWQQAGQQYLGLSDLSGRIKGQTLTTIFNTHFAHLPAAQTEITAALEQFEQQMEYEYIAGVCAFVEELHRHGVKTAIVTSSNAQKMAAVYQQHPEVKNLFGTILTAEMFTASKPAPDCFLLGMQQLGAEPLNTYIFEDSLNGLKAANASGANVIGLATTLPANTIAPLCHTVIQDFRHFTYDKMREVNK
ncbi:MAG: HAD family hydrolase [Mediterranea massiliensis]|nr:HAD family hydrolase [Mediterranea massiliensis]